MDDSPGGRYALWMRPKPVKFLNSSTNRRELERRYPGVGFDLNVRVGRGARIEPDVIVYWGVIIGQKARIGRGATIGPGVVVGRGAVVGRGVTLEPGAQVR